MSNKNKNITYLTTKSSTSKLRDIRSFIQENAECTNLQSKEIENLILAVDEACTNLIKHAYKNEYDNEINISFEIINNQINIKITDYASPFDLRDVESPNLELHFENYKKSGLGIFIIKSLVDSIDYKISNNGTKKNILILKKNLPR